MRNRTRLVLGAGAGLAALALAGPALAGTYTPKIEAGPAPAIKGTTIHVSLAPADDPTAKVKIYVPRGYTGDLTAGVGHVIGNVNAKVTAADLGGATLPLAGAVLVANPADFVGPPNNVCVPGTHQAVWLLVLTAAGQTLKVPAYVDAAAGAEAAIASYTIQICLPPPDVPAGTPGRATFGAKLFDAMFSINAFVGPTAAGDYRWRTLWTPYNPGLGTVNAAGTVEAQSVVKPATVSVEATYDKSKGSVSVSGTVTEGGAAVSGAKVFVLSGRAAGALRTVAAGTTDASGAYSGTATAKKGAAALFYSALAALAGRDLGAAACTATFASLGIKCVSATAGLVKALGTPVEVTIG